MPTIKTKKEMNLPQLIEWGWKNIEQVERKEFKSNIRDSFGNYSTVQFSVDGYGFKTDGVSHKDTFTVEIEEPITEDSKLEEIFLITNNSIYSEKCYNYSINDVLTNNEGYYEEIAMLILEPEPLIIWTKEKGMVE
ncbi:hypothetical protein ACW7DJ_00760 [Mammaliicoccus sciuri]